MPLFIECPAGHRLKVPRKRAGHRIVCPVCNRALLVPAAAKPLRRPQTGVDTLGESRPPESRPTSATDGLDQSPSDNLDPIITPPLHPAEVPANRAADDEQHTAVATGAAAAPEHQSSPPQSMNSGNPEPIAEGAFPNVRVDEFPPHQAASKPDFRASHQFGVFALGVVSIFVAAFCAIPSVADQIVATRVGVQPPDTWTYFVLLGSTLQIIVAIYTMRLPDWTTSWIAALFATAMAAVYSMVLALTMFANAQHPLVMQLGLLDEVFRHRAQPWCFLVVCISLILAYCYGRFSVRWYHLEKQLAPARF